MKKPKLSENTSQLRSIIYRNKHYGLCAEVHLKVSDGRVVCITTMHVNTQATDPEVHELKRRYLCVCKDDYYS